MNATTFDRQGERDDRQRLDAAMVSFAREYDGLTAMRLESCIHCGMCADACHYYIATQDPQFTPILKAEPLKQAYKREASPLAPFFKLLGLKRPVTTRELEEWQMLLFDACTMCGRCSLICPMGIDVASLIEQTRRAMFDAGLAPRELYEKAELQARTGAPEASDTPWSERLAAIGREHGVEIPVDRESAEILVCVPRTDIVDYPDAVLAMVKTLSHIGADFTFAGDAVVAENYGYYAGSRDWQRQISARLIEAAHKVGAKTIIVPECGHAYTALRWEAAELNGKPLDLKVRLITEFLAEQLAAGRLELRKADGGSVVFHDPCQLVRKGGAGEAPRALLKALGVPLKPLEYAGGFSFCCGGGGGVYDIARATPLRHRAMRNKLEEIDRTGADRLVTSCSDCRRNFTEAGAHFDWKKTPHSLLEMVAANLQDGRSET